MAANLDRVYIELHMSQQRNVITIDGPSGSGKSTLAKLLAEKLSYAHLNTGSIYRAVAYLAITNNVDCSDEESVLNLLKNAKIELKYSSHGEAETYLNGSVLGDEIRTVQISEGTSKVAVLKSVRESLKEIQRNAFPETGLVAEGRDMGTVIFPDATLKFYIDVDQDVRIERRLKQLEEAHDKGIKELGTTKTSTTKTTFDRNSLKEQMKIEIADRDKRDAEREIAPLKPAPDAIMIDNSLQTLTETLQNMYHHATQRGL